MNPKLVREIYKENLPYILRDYPMFDPYVLSPIFDFMTKIEENVWQDIRVLGLPMCPQFPVKGYFIDFADPVKKIGIEADGREYHQDKEKDLKRQIDIEKEGWKIYRIEGWQTFKDIYSYQDDHYDDAEDEEKEMIMRVYYRDCSEGILRRIKNMYYQDNRYEGRSWKSEMVNIADYIKQKTY